MAEILEQAQRLLYEHFGYREFRPAQSRLITEIENHHDVLGIMPTGAGKSMCYQIPALMEEGITLVVSPLISLMQDQVRALKAAGIAGAYLNSSLTYRQYLKALDNARAGMYKIIYVAPERLMTEEFLYFACNINISILAVDEAHCVSQWGHDFRPSYMDIPKFLAELPKRPVVAAFTATATPNVRDDIVKLLGLDNPAITVTGFDRENLFFSVQRPANKSEALLEFIAKHPGVSGIIYCSTRKQTERIAALLKENKIPAGCYHGGMDENERRNIQNEYLYDRIKVMVATNAFGMGIDKQNVSYVVHYNMPKNMESYYQEAGRAGRDGSEAECLLLYGPGDIHTAEYLINNASEDSGLSSENAAKQKSLEHDKLEKMKQYCFTTGCLRNYILNYFGEVTEKDCGNCGTCKARSNIYKALTAAPQKKTHTVERTLYEMLRSVRTDFAEKAGIPAELVFNDRTLREMAAQKPSNEYEMMQISGVSPSKYQLYGKVFLRVIQRNSHRKSGIE